MPLAERDKNIKVKKIGKRIGSAVGKVITNDSLTLILVIFILVNLLVNLKIILTLFIILYFLDRWGIKKIIIKEPEIVHQKVKVKESIEKQKDA